MKIEPFEGKQIVASRPPAGCEVVAYEGAIRSSKTIVSLIGWARYCRRGPAGNLLMVGKTIDVLIRNLLEPMVEIFGAHRVTWNRGLGTASILGRNVYIMGANDQKARSKVQGLTLAGAYVDEATNIPEEFFEMLHTRLSIPGARLYLTCNPEGPKHWLLVKWLSRARWWVHADGQLEVRPGDTITVRGEEQNVLPWFRVTFVLEDNVWLVRHNPGFIANLKLSHVGVFYQRMIESKWVSADGMVYPQFSEAEHVIPVSSVPPIEYVLAAAVDYGTNHRTRGYLLGLGRVVYGPDGMPRWGADATQGRPQYALFILSEFAPGTMTVGQHAAAFEDWLRAQAGWGKPEWIAVDPAALVFKAELYNRDHGNVINAHNAVLSGIQTVEALLATHRLFIVDTCTQLIEGIPGYMWDTKATERGKTEPLKEGDDEVDGLRYAVYTTRREWRELIPLAPIDTPDQDEGDEAA